MQQRFFLTLFLFLFGAIVFPANASEEPLLHGGGLSLTAPAQYAEVPLAFPVEGVCDNQTEIVIWNHHQKQNPLIVACEQNSFRAEIDFEDDVFGRWTGLVFVARNVQTKQWQDFALGFYHVTLEESVFDFRVTEPVVSNKDFPSLSPTQVMGTCQPGSTIRMWQGSLLNNGDRVSCDESGSFSWLARWQEGFVNVWTGLTLIQTHEGVDEKIVKYLYLGDDVSDGDGEQDGGDDGGGNEDNSNDESEQNDGSEEENDENGGGEQDGNDEGGADGEDAHPGTPGVVDSFGEIAVPDDSGPAWSAIRSYHGSPHYDEEFCDYNVHKKYWVQSPEDGQYYPTWHPPVDAASGCAFGHEHGDDPRDSSLYAISGGVPFGFVHGKLHHGGSHGDRQEDHVGHKVVVRDDWTAVAGNPVNKGDAMQELGDDFTCNWLSKIHQGTHSTDALGNNLHEYFLNISCGEDMHVSVKTLAVWGAPSRIFNECSDVPSYSGDDPYKHPGLIDVGYVSSVSPPVYAEDPNPGNDDPFELGFSTNDGKRSFDCVRDRIAGYKDLMELWKPDGVMKTPDNNSVFFSPYYIVHNSNRYIDPDWKEHGRSGSVFSSVDLCVRGSDAWNNILLKKLPEYKTNNKYPRLCELNNLDENLRSTWESDIADVLSQDISQQERKEKLLLLEKERRYHPENPFDGSRRAVHPKRVQIYNKHGKQNTPEGYTRFCTDPYGKSPQWPEGDGSCPHGTITQTISSQSNYWDSIERKGADGKTITGISGSSIGSRNYYSDKPQSQADTREPLIAPGMGREWIVDYSSAEGVRAPN